ncbi:ABC transporter permease [Ectopseudomonas composti]
MIFFFEVFLAFRLMLRAKLVWVAFGIVVVVLLATFLSSYFSGRQLATVALDVGVSTIRLLLPLLVVLLSQEVLFREFDKRYYLSSLAYPRARSALLLGRVLAMFIFIAVLLLVLGLLQGGLVRVIGGFYSQATSVALGKPYVIVLSFIALDLLVLVSLATLLAVVASTPSFILIGTLGFMLVARSYGSIVELLSREAGLVSNPEHYRTSLGGLGYLLPDLGALDVRMIALYGKMDFLPADWFWLLLSCLSYSFALLALSVWALQRKRLS